MPSEELEHQGWHISCTTTSISKEGALDALKARLGPGVFSLPEQLFGENALVLRHAATGLALRFGALGALLAWRADARPPVKVGVAAAWRSAHAQQLRESGAVELDYDWTYSTSYGGDVEVEAPVTHPGGGAPSDRKQGPGVRWEASGAPLNRAPLLRRDPILLYADVPLYASELDDHGASQLSVKVRVMPRCWLVLLRFWLRVDGVLVRLRETRYLAELLGPASDPDPPADGPRAISRPLGEEKRPSEQEGLGAGCEGRSSQDGGVVGGGGGGGPTWRLTREVKCSEGTFEELQAHGAPGSGPSYADADSTALALQAVAPVGVSEFRTEVCRLWPAGQASEEVSTG